MAEAQEPYAKHVSEVKAQLDASEKKILAGANTQATVDHVAFSSLGLRAHQWLKSICREGFKAPLAKPEDGYAKITSMLVVELEGTTQKVDVILEEEFNDAVLVAVHASSATFISVTLALTSAW